MADAAATPLSRTLRTAWIVVALLCPVAMLNYLDRQMLTSMKKSVTETVFVHADGEQSPITDQQWGYMLGQFKWVYAFCSPLGGYLADRFRRRYVICGSLFIWSGITFATGLVQDYNALLWTRTLMGISEACYIPAALALIADLHSDATRARAVGVHQTAINAGVILGGFCGYMENAPWGGWRLAFYLTGFVGVAYAVPLLMLLHDAPQAVTAEHVQARHRVSLPVALGELLRNRSFLLLVTCFTLPALAGWIVKDWMAPILQKEFKIDQGVAGVSATLYVSIAALIAVFVGGWLADRWMQRTRRGRIYVSALGMSLLIPALFGVGNSGSLNVAIGFLILFGVGWGFFDCNNMPILSQIARPELRATGYGVMNLVSMLGGGFADWGFGALQDANVPLNVTFGLFAAAALVSIVLVLLIRVRSTADDLA